MFNDLVYNKVSRTYSRKALLFSKVSNLNLIVYELAAAPLEASSGTLKSLRYLFIAFKFYDTSLCFAQVSQIIKKIIFLFLLGGWWYPSPK